MEKLILPLDGTNYSTWKLQVRMLLLNLNLWDIVMERESPPTSADGLYAFNVRKSRALSTIVLTIKPSLLYLIGDPSDPIVVWKKLEKHYQGSTWANQFSLRKKLYSMKMVEGDSVLEHVRTATELFDNLTAVGDILKDKDRVMILMSSLSAKFDVLITALQSNKDMPTWDELVERIKAEEDRQVEREPEPTVALYTNSDHTKKSYDVSKEESICFYCKKAGHFKKDCYAYRRKQKERNYGFGHSDSGQVNVAADCAEEVIGFLVSEQKMFGAIHDAKSSSGWLLDSGATSHMTRDYSHLVNPKELEVPVRVRLANGDEDYATAIGDINLNLYVNNRFKSVVLFDVLYIKGLTANLVSVRKAVQRNLKVTFEDRSAKVLDRNFNVLCEFVQYNNLYQLKGLVSKSGDINTNGNIVPEREIRKSRIGKPLNKLDEWANLGVVLEPKSCNGDVNLLYHHAKELVEKNLLVLNYCKSQFMIADIAID